MNVVLDANIYVSALIARDGNPAKILSLWREGKIDVVVSPAIIEEVRRVTGYPRLLNRYKGIRENRDELIATLKEIAIVVEPDVKVSVVEQDESDNRYVECALTGNAAYIVTGDPHLLTVREHQGVTIVTPAAFLALVSTGRV